jgi:EpsI family protein
MSFLSSKYSRGLTLVLLLQALAYYAIARRPESTPAVQPLTLFPTSFDGWRMVNDVPVAREIQEFLKADDTMNRVYANRAGTDAASLFIAFFKTQRYGQSPHSPKNCLPGAGWEAVSDEKIPVKVPGWDQPIIINRYVVEHGDEKGVTLYWYHSHNRVIADELSAKFWAVADSIRYHRSDTELVRVIAEVHNNNVEAATKNGLQFIQSVFPEILKQLPL